jgi:uncharacterized membrane protein YbhN (UPF0104 family)
MPDASGLRPALISRAAKSPLRGHASRGRDITMRLIAAFAVLVAVAATLLVVLPRSAGGGMLDRIRWDWVGVAVIAYIGAFVSFAARGFCLAPANSDKKASRYIEIAGTVVAIHNAFPLFGGAGSASALVLLVTRAGLSTGAAASVLAMDAVFTGPVRLILVGWVLLNAPFLPIDVNPLLFVATIAMLVCATFAVAFFGREFTVCTHGLAPSLGRFATWLTEWSIHLAPLRDVALAIRVVALEIGGKLLELGSILAIQLALGIPPSPYLALAIVAGLYIATNVSILPGSLGFYDAVIIAIYVGSGVPVEVAVTAAVIQHVIALSPTLASLRILAGNRSSAPN